MTAIGDPTDHEAHWKPETYRRHVSTEGTIALLSGYLGIDFVSTDLDQPLNAHEISAIQSSVDTFVRTAVNVHQLRPVVE
jgi:long-chain alkane monooxygenase